MKGTAALKNLTKIIMVITTTVILGSAISGNLIRLNNLQGQEKVVVTNLLYIFSYIGLVIFNLALYQLLKVIQSIEEKDFFNLRNIKRFKYISYGVWYFVVVIMISNCIAKKVTGVIVIESGSSGIIDLKVVSLIFLALFTEILSGIFTEAYKIKESEEVLKQENELTI